MCTPNNMDKKKLGFLKKDFETKQKRIEELESLLDAIICAEKSGQMNDFDKIGMRR